MIVPNIRAVGIVVLTGKSLVNGGSWTRLLLLASLLVLVAAAAAAVAVPAELVELAKVLFVEKLAALLVITLFKLTTIPSATGSAPCITLKISLVGLFRLIVVVVVPAPLWLVAALALPVLLLLELGLAEAELAKGPLLMPAANRWS